MGELPDLGVPYRFEPPADGDETSGVTLLLLHGAAGDEASLLEPARRVAPWATLLSPRGMLPDDDGGFRHLPRRSVDKPENPDDTDPHVEAVHQQAGELVEFVATACKALDLDAGGVWAFGFSDGATAACALAYDHPDSLAGAMVLSGRAPFRAPRGRVLDHKQIFCATGRLDETVTMDDYEELVEGLVTAGADVELHWYDAGHEIPDQALEDAGVWLRKRLA